VRAGGRAGGKKRGRDGETESAALAGTAVTRSQASQVLLFILEMPEALVRMQSRALAFKGKTFTLNHYSMVSDNR
jgi:hypothetical protein